MIECIKFTKERTDIIDQTLLPNEEKIIHIPNYKAMIEAIKKLRIRGAPAIGIAASAAGYLAALELKNSKNFIPELTDAIVEIEASRPTAVNLFMATNLLRNIIKEKSESQEVINAFYENTINLMKYEKDACEKMGENGAEFIGKKELKILTHCNTGSLATYGIGTALGVIRKLAQNQKIHVYVDETRPLLQGARLTMWELIKSGISCSLISDNMAASIIRSEKVDLIITGADRIAANGDSANKIGTFNLAILAKHFGIPFFIAAPDTTIDREISTGEEIKIEQRNPEEVRNFRSTMTGPVNCNCENPAFDVTPAELITAIFTDEKSYTYPYKF